MEYCQSRIPKRLYVIFLICTETGKGLRISTSLKSTRRCSPLIKVYLEREIMIKFICYPKCTTCQRAKKWLDDNNIEYELRDIKLDNPTLKELTEWYQNSGLPLKKFFNTSGLLYKSLDLKNKLPEMSEDEMLKLLATDGMLVKRPLVVGDSFVLVGFKEIEWLEKLNK